MNDNTTASIATSSEATSCRLAPEEIAAFRLGRLFNQFKSVSMQAYLLGKALARSYHR